MTVLETFVSFANGLPTDRLRSIEDTLSTLMATYSDEQGFTSEELAELDRRANTATPEYADPGTISKLLAKRAG